MKSSIVASGQRPSRSASRARARKLGTSASARRSTSSRDITPMRVSSAMTPSIAIGRVAAIEEAQHALPFGAPSVLVHQVFILPRGALAHLGGRLDDLGAGRLDLELRLCDHDQ